MSHLQMLGPTPPNTAPQLLSLPELVVVTLRADALDDVTFLHPEPAHGWPVMGGLQANMYSSSAFAPRPPRGFVSSKCNNLLLLRSHRTVRLPKRTGLVEVQLAVTAVLSCPVNAPSAPIVWKMP
jgi:hypothetical protein